MLDVVQGAGLRNVLVVVTRYFGGTLLGTGGLVRAYSQAVQEGLANSVLIDEICGVRLLIETDYNGIGKIQYLLGQRGIPILESEYTDQVKIRVLVPKNGGGPSLRGDYRGDERKGKNWKKKRSCTLRRTTES